jgi:polysaccharide pyruvyl transferase WcaK-like protein
MKITVLGFYDCYNIGDEAFRPALNHLLEGHEVTYANPNNIQDLPDPDIVILGGGAVVNPYFLDHLPKGCPSHITGVDLGYESEMNLLEKGNIGSVAFRNQTDADAAKSRLKCPVFAIPDLAFFIQPKNQPQAIYQQGKNKKAGVFATDYVNPSLERSWKNFGDRAYSFAEKLGKELDELAEKGWQVYLFCCSTGGYGDDRRMALQLKTFMRSQPILILDTLTPQEMIEAMTAMDLTVCQRFHSHIFSIIAGVPLVSIDFTRKVRILLSEMNIRDQVNAAWFDGQEFNTSKFSEVVSNVLKSNMGESLLSIAHNNHQKLLDSLKTIRQVILG